MNWGFDNYYSGGFRFLLPFVLFDLILKGFALWRAARKGQNVWFVVLLVVNSMGILPLIYLVLNRAEKETPKKAKKSK